MSAVILKAKEVVRGAPVIECYSFNFADGTETLPLDLRLFSRIKMDIRRNDNSFTPAIYSLDSAANDDSITISGDDHNVLTISHRSAQTLLFKEKGLYYRDLFFYNGTTGFPILIQPIKVIFNKTEQ